MKKTATPSRSELSRALSRCRDAVVTVALFSAVVNLLMMVSPMYMMQVYDRVLSSRSEATLLVLTGLAIGLLVVLSVLELLRSRILVRVSGKLDEMMRDRILSAQFRGLLTRAEGANAQGLRDFDTIRQFLSGPGPFAFFDAPWTPLLIGVMFVLHPVLGIIALVGGLMLLVLAIGNEWATKTPLEQANREAATLQAAIDGSQRNIEVVEAMGMLANLRRRWEVRRNELLCIQAAASDRAAIFTYGGKLFRMLLQTVLLGAGAWLAIHGEMSAGAIIGSSILMGRALAPIETAVGTWKQVVLARLAWRRLNTLLDAVPPQTERTSLPRPTGNLSVESVTCIPPGASAPTLRAVTFFLKAGEVLGVIGPSGAGKTSLARLLVGAWRPQAGTVRLDGADLHDWDSTERGPSMGYLPQDIELFEGTIAENICRFGPLDSDRIIAAAKAAQVHELILRQPQGYETQVGLGGAALSGGQRQRIALARALYGDPSLIVLDEPNSNLDDVGEAALVQALSEARARGASVIIISHRPSVLGIADQIMVLAEGTVRAFGSRSEIMSRFTRPVVAGQGSGTGAFPAPGDDQQGQTNRPTQPFSVQQVTR